MFKKILVCLDGSKLAEQILLYVLHTAKKFDSTVNLLEVVTMPEPVTVPRPGLDPVSVSVPVMPTNEKLQEELKQAMYYLDLSAKPYRDEGIEVAVDTPLVPGAVGEAIVNYAADNDIDLIAMATHGRGGIKRMVMGSVSDYILRNSNIPMLVIKPKEKKDG